MNVLLKWYLLVFLSTSHILAYKMFVIDKDCFLRISRNNHTLKFNLSRALMQEANEIHGTDEVLSNLNVTAVSIILRFCHKLSTQCSALTCLHLKNNSNLLDIGSTLISAEYHDELLNMKFTSKSRCHESYSENYTTTIVHRCTSQHPVITLDEYKECNFKILWISSIGCPVKEYSSINSCFLTTPTRRYDLRPLNKYMGYTHHIGQLGTFKDVDIYFNLCGYLPSSFCGPKAYLCVKSKENGNIIAESNKFIFAEVDDSKTSIVFYKSNGGKVEISLVCESGLSNSVLEYSYQTNQDIYLILRNTIICKPDSVDCLIYEINKTDNKNDNVYNLSILRKYSGNWKIFDKAGNQLIFNVCGTLNYEPGLMCGGGNVFACYKTITNHTIIGTSQNPAIVHKNGYISFNYSGGYCDMKTPYIMNVSLICSTIDSKPSLRLAKCSFFILWYTRAACPTQYYPGSKCIANDIKVNYLFNENKFYTVETLSNEKFHINLCQPLRKSCGGEQNISVCWINEYGNEIPIGFAGYEPIYTDGHVKFIIEGKPCYHNVSRSIVIVELQCDYNGFNTLPVFINKSDYCEFTFKWFTNLVCKEGSDMNCQVQNKLKKYDLTPLMKSNSNYEIKVENGLFFINICQSIIPGPNFKCSGLPTSVGACYFNDDFQEINAGTISNPLKIINDTLQLSYISGDICNSSKRADYNTIINFYCDPNGNSSSPTFLNYHECVFTFKWDTRFACPVPVENKFDENDVISSEVRKLHLNDSFGPNHNNNSTPSAEVPITADVYKILCTVENPYNKYKFDLRPLMEKDWTIDKSLKISICRPLRNSNGCPDSSGSCLHASNNFIDMGTANGDLKYKDGILYLNYTGTNCKSTLIYFYCHELTEPTVEEDIDHCVTVIHWNTPLACQADLKNYCCENNSGTLCSVRDTYPVSFSNKTLYLSICKFPKFQPELSCKKNLGCLDSNIFSNTFTKGHELSQKNTFEFIEFQHIFGKICSGQVHSLYKITLKLYCDHRVSQNGPMFVSKTNDCNFNLEWRSNYFCKDVVDNKSLTSCKSIENSKLQNMIENLQRSRIKNITSQYSNASYYFNFCDKSNVCKTDICKSSGTNLWNKYARIHHITSGRNPNITILHYTLLGSHNSGLCGAEIRLTCNASKGEGLPVIINETPCNLEVNWESKLACVYQVDPVFFNVETTHHNATATKIIIILVLILVCTAAFFIWKKWPRIRLLSCRRFTYTQDIIDDHTEL